MRAALLSLVLLLPGGGLSAGSAVTGADLDEIRGVIHRQIDACVYRPVRVSFLDLLVIGTDVVQPAQVTDRSGAVWVAYFSMQRQRDGSWRTYGCRLVAPVRTISA
jgi:hypothetical protein